jgi:ubiquinone/menaquinone biosynthesis C-methylase UbiE
MNDRKYLEEQYKDASKLDARVQLHQQFSVNKYGWHRWVFDHFNFPATYRILELGCGAGYLWVDNLDRLPSGFEIVLSDFSSGMLEQTRQNLKGRRGFQFEVIDAQSIPFENENFDAVIANHMLNHVPDKPKAFSEIHRVLKPGGIFYATTVGQSHLSEIVDLLKKFDPEMAVSWGVVTYPFTLENGAAQLSPWFGNVTRDRYEDAFEVTEVAPLVDYILSGLLDLEGNRRDQFRKFVAREMEAHSGIFNITKDSGLFVSARGA